MGWLDHMVAVFLFSWGTSVLFSRVVVPVCILDQQCTRVPFSPRPCQHLLPLTFLVTDMLTSVKWYFSVVLICFPLMINDVEHLFHAPVGHLYVFFGEKSVQFLCPLFNWFSCFFFFAIELLEFLVYFECKPFIRYMVCIYFLNSLGCFFIVLWFPFTCRRFLVDVVPYYLLWLLLPLLLVSNKKKIVVKNNGLSPVFSKTWSFRSSVQI